MESTQYSKGSYIPGFYLPKVPIFPEPDTPRVPLLPWSCFPSVHISPGPYVSRILFPHVPMVPFSWSSYIPWIIYSQGSYFLGSINQRFLYFQGPIYSRFLYFQSFNYQMFLNSNGSCLHMDSYLPRVLYSEGITHHGFCINRVLFTCDNMFPGSPYSYNCILYSQDHISTGTLYISGSYIPTAL